MNLIDRIAAILYFTLFWVAFSAAACFVFRHVLNTIPIDSNSRRDTDPGFSSQDALLFHLLNIRSVTVNVSPPRIPRSGVQRLNRDSMNAVMVLLSAVGVPTAENEHRFREQLAAAMERARRINLELQYVLTKFCGLRFQPPSIELPPFANGFDLQAVLQAFTLWAEQIVAQFDVRRIGTVTWHGRNRVTVTFVDSATRPGLMNRDTTYIEHNHEILRPRLHPATHPEITLPRRASGILRGLNVLLPHTAILTGTLVGQGQQVLDTERSRTAFGRAFDSGVAATKKGIRAAGRGVRAAAPAAGVAAGVGGLAALGAVALKALATTATAAVVVVDPAILIGDRALYGWIEE